MHLTSLLEEEWEKNWHKLLHQSLPASIRQHMEEKNDFILALRCILWELSNLCLGVVAEMPIGTVVGPVSCLPASAPVHSPSERILWHETYWSFQSGLRLPDERASSNIELIRTGSDGFVPWETLLSNWRQAASEVELAVTATCSSPSPPSDASNSCKLLEFRTHPRNSRIPQEGRKLRLLSEKTW